MQVNLDHAHTALPYQTSPIPGPHQRYLAVLLSPFALCLLLHVATQCAPYVEVLARITSSEYHLSNQAKLTCSYCVAGCRLLSTFPHQLPRVPLADLSTTSRAQMKVRGSTACCATVDLQLDAPTYDSYFILCRLRMPWPLLACWQSCHQQQMQGGCFSLPPLLMQTFLTSP